MTKTILFAVAVTAMGIGAFTAASPASNSGKSTIMASGGSNCPVYYGCPAAPPPPPGGGGGGGKGGGGGADNPPGHA